MALLTKVKSRMAIHAHRKVRSLLDGEYASVHTGRSLDFNDLREYVVGDDVKDIDWKASARRGDLLIKRYVADRKHTVTLLVATGDTMAAMCDAHDSKRDLAIMVAGIFGYLATRHSDYVTLIAGNSGGVSIERPSTTEVALERMLAIVQSQCQPDSPRSDLTACLEYAVRNLHRRTIMIVIADDVPLERGDLDLLRRLRAQHEILYVTLADLDPSDPELAGRRVVNVTSRSALPGFLLGDAQLRSELAAAEVERHRARTKELDKLGIASEHVSNEADIVPSVFALLERHRHARR